jgi:hypothetical protein
MSESTSKKFASRKFIAWLVWTAIVALYAYRAQITAELITWYGIVTSLYLGTNVAMDYIYSGKTGGKNGLDTSKR